MQEEAKRVDSFSMAPGTGVLGRASDSLTAKGFKVNKITIDNPSISLVGWPGESPPPLIVSRGGAKEFNKRPDRESTLMGDMQAYIADLNSEADIQSSSVFGEHWSNEIIKGIEDAATLQTLQESARLSTAWDGLDQTNTWKKFNTISKLIQTRGMRGTDRDIFFMEIGGWDHHSALKANLRAGFKELNEALAPFVAQLKVEGIWDDVSIVFTSDFARTITPNTGKGSDHAWGGHYWMIEGNVNGGKILGQYPDDITESGPLNLKRGRILPTTSWEAIWNGVGEWLGEDEGTTNIADNELSDIIPNRGQVVEPGFKLFTASDLYKNVNLRHRKLRRRRH